MPGATPEESFNPFLPLQLLALPTRCSLYIGQLAPLFTWMLDDDLALEESAIATKVTFSVGALFKNSFWIVIGSLVFLTIRLRLFPHTSLWECTWRERLALLFYTFVDAAVIIFADSSFVSEEGDSYGKQKGGGGGEGVIILLYLGFVFAIPAVRARRNPGPRVRLSYF